MLSDWQHLPAQINPNLFTFGAFQVRYYSLMYLVAFALTYALIMHRIKKENYDYSAETIQDCFVWLILGLILGARLGYVLFYNFSYYLGHPLEIFLPFDFTSGIRFTGISGMSYHGGAIGVVFATLIFCRRHRISFWRLADLFVPAIPLGYTFGRIGNFINGELYGRATSVAWGMIFPLDPLQVVRHPSQLYEAFFEGLALFAVLWTIRRRSPFDGFLLALYLMGYGLVRFFIEFYREPDAHIGLIWVSLTTGQVLCLLMMAAGAIILIWRHYAVSHELTLKKHVKNTVCHTGKT
ncbi:MAG: prolipoprotein diacylglyceryl transferase [Pseudomonadota bacterium]